LEPQLEHHFAHHQLEHHFAHQQLEHHFAHQQLEHQVAQPQREHQVAQPQMEPHFDHFQNQNFLGHFDHRQNHHLAPHFDQPAVDLHFHHRNTLRTLDLLHYHNTLQNDLTHHTLCTYASLL
jgi:hypothetical protein